MAVTRDHVARAAGVSPAVVSYVLNGGPRPVSAQARQRVLQAVAELGYRPDALARSLRSGRSDTVGLIVPDGTNPFFAELSRAIEDAAYALGLRVLVGNSADDIARERSYIQNLAERRVTGLVLISARGDEELSELITLSIPVVAVDRTPDDSPVSTVRVDNVHSAMIGTGHLIEHGHRRIGLVAGPAETGVINDRTRGWRDALRRAGLPPGPTASGPFSYEGGHRAAHELLTAAEPPTAVLVTSDVQAIGFLNAAATLGLQVPRDVAVVSFDGTSAGAFTVPRLTSILQPIPDIADHAVQLLVDRGGTARHLQLSSTLEVRASCGCATPGQASRPPARRSRRIRGVRA